MIDSFVRLRHCLRQNDKDRAVIMISKFLPLAAVLALVACGGGNPLGTGTGDDDGSGDDGGIVSDRVLPPGTASPSRNTSIRRYEAKDAEGNGYARDLTYDAATDTFSVDNLGFDGANSYKRGVAVGSLGPYAVYESAMSYADDVTGRPIDQFNHRAIYGVSKTGQTEFAVVRTGAYVDYGFGGFAYQRNGSVTLPTSGQAAFTGAYAGLRDFKGIGGLEYATGDMRIDIDFRDFNDGNAVKGYVANRAIYDLAGNDITNDVLAALNTKNSTTETALPTLVFKVGPGVMDINGEIAGELNSFVQPTGKAVEEYEAGKYYAVVSGTDPDEVTGIIVVESDDPRNDGVTARETGGFILYRKP